MASAASSSTNPTPTYATPNKSRCWKRRRHRSLPEARGAALHARRLVRRRKTQIGYEVSFTATSTSPNPCARSTGIAADIPGHRARSGRTPGWSAEARCMTIEGAETVSRPAQEHDAMVASAARPLVNPTGKDPVSRNRSPFVRRSPAVAITADAYQGWSIITQAAERSSPSALVGETGTARRW